MHNQASQAAERVEWFHPGEIVIVARVPKGSLSDENLRAGMRDLLDRHARDHVRRDAQSLRSFVFDAPTEDQSLVFFVQKLAQAGDARSVKNAVEALHGQLGNLRANNLEVIGAMPQWHLLAHEAFSGGSPGSRPAPVYADQVRGRPTRRAYRPVKPNLDLAERVRDAEAVPVAILDTRIDLAEARRHAERFKTATNNQQLIDTIDSLRQPPASDADVDGEWRAIREHHTDGTSRAGGQASADEATYPMADHGLFVAGLIHGIAPRASLSYEAVLDETGVGDLSLLLIALQRVLARKRQDQPQIINLSLGFRPHPGAHDRRLVRLAEAPRSAVHARRRAVRTRLATNGGWPGIVVKSDVRWTCCRPASASSGAT